MLTFVIIPALILGFLGSFHCVGMCGPIALSLPVQHLSGLSKVIGILLYNLGRVITYSVLGFLLGLIGKTFTLFTTQQTLSIIIGIVFIAAFLLSIFRKRIINNVSWIQPWNKWITNKMLPFFHKKNLFILLLLGIFNGLLPCGLVYMALAGALAFSTSWHSVIFMASFGLGTLPAMASLSFAGNIITLSMRNKIKKLTPYIIGFMGLLFVLRGMNLNIPYLSPTLKKDKVECCHRPESA